MRIKLTGWFSDDKVSIKVTGKGWHKTIDKSYIKEDKIKEMEEYGYAYCNRDKSLLV